MCVKKEEIKYGTIWKTKQQKDRKALERKLMDLVIFWGDYATGIEWVFLFGKRRHWV
jgi:hypothetical protein